jgi:predicted CXXCH cytochrome family protein
MLHKVGLVIAMIGLALIATSGAWLGPANATTPRPAKPNTATTTCSDEGCHNTLVGQRFMHGPVAQHKCEACHSYVEPREHQFASINVAELCATCHPLSHRTVVHEPVRTGNCTGCHDPHGSPHRMMLVDDPTKGLCLNCHKPEQPAKKFEHGPYAAGGCILCHQPHSSWQPQLLVKPVKDLCGDCHSEVRQQGPGLHVHAAMDQGCSSCHNAHASDHRFILHEQTPGLCRNCHESTLHAIDAAPVAHGAVHIDGGCSNCHSPHASTLPKLQRHVEPQACLTCHDQDMQTADGRNLTNMAKLLQNHPDHHGPIREGSCSACHQPHGGDRANLLTMGYPPDFYAPFNMDRYSLCFNCHLPEMVTQRAGAGVTRFRDGDRNLHWLHVNQEKGRTCRACHEVHASSRPFHIRDAVPFGTSGWMLEINFQATEDGGTCAPGCHSTTGYARGEKSPVTRRDGER